MIRQFALLFSIFLSVICTAQNPLDKDVIDDGVRALFKAEHKKNIGTYTDRSRYLLRTGVVADKKTREVRILAVATGNKGDVPLEYVLVGEAGKHYESLASTLAKPSDVHAAMEFIGMKAGYTIRPMAFHLWSKGDEIALTLNWKDGAKVISHPIQALLKYPESNTFIKEGWIFTGSFHYKRNGDMMYAADDAGDLISTFNSSWTVFDVSAGAGQKEVYGTISPSPLYTPGFQHQLELVITPKLPQGETRNIDLKLELLAPAEKPVTKGDDIVFNLTEVNGDKALVSKGTFKQVLDAVTPYIEKDKKVYTQVVYNEHLPVGPLSEVMAVIDHIGKRNLLRIEHTKGQIFYQAFIPDQSWREPRNRPVQPLEIFLSGSPDKPNTFRFYDEDFMPTGRTKLTEIKKTFQSPADLDAILKLKEEWITQAILFYVPPDTRPSDIQKYYTSLAKTYPLLFILPNTK